MKTQSKKLELKTETIVELNNNQLQLINGGTTTISTTLFDPDSSTNQTGSRTSTTDVCATFI
jgi:hypothetical protein